MSGHDETPGVNLTLTSLVHSLSLVLGTLTVKVGLCVSQYLFEGSFTTPRP